MFNALVQFHVDIESFYEHMTTTLTPFARACRPELQSIDLQNQPSVQPIEKRIGQQEPDSNATSKFEIFAEERMGWHIIA